MEQENPINPPKSNSSYPILKILPQVTTGNHNTCNRNIIHLNNILQTDKKMSKVVNKYNFINSIESTHFL